MILCDVEIVMVRLQGDFAKPPEKTIQLQELFRCAFQGMYPISLYSPFHYSTTLLFSLLSSPLSFPFYYAGMGANADFVDGERRRSFIPSQRSRPERVQGYIDER